eukprot:1144997-Pelagomonas_calceolata.AAC.5
MTCACSGRPGCSQDGSSTRCALEIKRKLAHKANCPAAHIVLPFSTMTLGFKPFYELSLYLVVQVPVTSRSKKA